MNHPTNESGNHSGFQQTWRRAPLNLHLAIKEIHVWRASLVQPDDVISKYCAVLAPGEVEKANRYHLQRDARRYTMARGILRKIIGRYLGTDPERCRFIQNESGKPALAPPHGDLCFNVSHSDELALFACAFRCDVGIDIEVERDDLDILTTAERYFSAIEYEAIRALPPAECIPAFFQCWTRKEAWIKAAGKGLSAQCLAETLLPVIVKKGYPASAGRCSIRDFTIIDLEAGAGYAAALAFREGNRDLQFWEWHV